MLKEPSKPKSLEIFQALEGRMTLSQTERATFRRLSSGYQGERLFYQKVGQHLPKNYPAYFDVSLTVNGSLIQLDVIIPTQSQLYHLEIKNYANTYTIENQHWLLGNDQLIQNPLLQLERAKGLLTMFNQSQQINLPVSSFLVFLQPSFHLYQASKTLPIIYPNMIDSFLKKISLESAYSSPKLQQVLYRHHQPHSIFEKIPTYTGNQLKKGFFCKACGEKLWRKTQKKHACPRCHQITKVSADTIQAIVDYYILFPNEKITNQKLMDWVDGAVDRSYMQRKLSQILKMIKFNRGTHYVKKI